MDNLRVGVVGVGHLGRHHARIYHQLGVLAAVTDLNPENTKEYREIAFTNYQDLFQRVDAVSIAVPTLAHFEIAKDFLERGIPTLVEKPLTKTFEQGEALVRLAREKKALLAVGHVERFNPAVAAALRVIQKPRFIEVHRLSPFRFRSSDIDVVMDLMIHDIDIVLHLVQSPLIRIDAVGADLLFGREDIANARLEFEDGCIANLTASRISEKTMRKIRIFTENQYTTIDTLEKQTRIYRTTPQLAAAIKKMPKDRELTLDDLAAIPKEFYSIEQVQLTDEEPLLRELKSFVECVRTGREPEVPGEHGLRAMKAAEQILAEMRSHRWK
jgi:predicted dehydrogenase